MKNEKIDIQSIIVRLVDLVTVMNPKEKSIFKKIILILDVIDIIPSSKQAFINDYLQSKVIELQERKRSLERFKMDL